MLSLPGGVRGGVVKAWVPTVAGASRPNTRGYPNQDRWEVGAGPAGAWAVVADGITGGPRGAEAAETAVAAMAAVLNAGGVSLSSVLRGFATAQACVSPWYSAGPPGGTTLSVVCVADGMVSGATVGDSPVWLLCRAEPEAEAPMTQDQHAAAGGGPGATSTSGASWRSALELRTAAAPQQGPLNDWVGSGGLVEPVMFQVPAQTVLAVVVCSDGVAPASLSQLVSSWPIEPRLRRVSASRAVNQLMAGESVDGDDVTVAVIALPSIPDRPHTSHDARQSAGQMPEADPVGGAP